jgi:hypothetical protein
MARIIPFEVISFLGRKEKVVVLYQKFSKNANDLDELREAASRTMAETVQPYYASINKSVNAGVFNFLLEPLKNANFYSNSLDKILFGVMMSKKGLIALYNDGGEYFKKQDVKECYENRIKHPENFPPNRGKGTGYGVGTGLIYDLSDFIYVDTAKGTLYTGLSIENKVFRSI